MPALEENSGEASDQGKQNCSTHPADAGGPVVSCCFVVWLLAEFLVLPPGDSGVHPELCALLFSYVPHHRRFS